ncbi:MAG TPA: hypothetical protein VI837_12910 [Blastocatellia bacterium]|nr:hypothetical protein [Blastocatellia bacterium]
MSDELTKKLPNDVPDTEPTILTLMERLRSMQEVMDRRHIETQELITSVRDDINGVRDDINGVRDDINKRVDQKHELLMSRIDLLRTETDAHFRKQGHVIRALNDAFLEIRGDHRELFERIAVLEEKAP